MGYSGKQLPSGNANTGPCVGPPNSIRSRLRRGVRVSSLSYCCWDAPLSLLGSGDAPPLPPTAPATGVSSLAGVVVLRRLAGYAVVRPLVLVEHVGVRRVLPQRRLRFCLRAEVGAIPTDGGVFVLRVGWRGGVDD